MLKIKNNFINKLPNIQKFIFVVLMLVLIGSLFISSRVFTAARYKDRDSSSELSIWDGTVASSYNSGEGTINAPYIISNGSELAYFSLQLQTHDYENVYFKLSGDIMLNMGLFDYDSDDNEVKYIIDDTIYSLDPDDGKYYEDSIQIGTINSFDPLNGFKGNFDGDMFTIYGLFSSGINNLGLFTNLEGTVKNLYVENAIIYGGSSTAGIVSNTNNASLKNILFNGYVIGSNDSGSVSGGIVANANNTILENVANKAFVSGYSSGGLVGKITGESTVKQSYNAGKIKGVQFAGGLISEAEDSLFLDKVYNAESVTSIGVIGGLIGDITDECTVSISDSFNTTNISVGQITDSTLLISNSYIINGSTAVFSNVNSTVPEEFLLTNVEELKTKSFSLNTLNYNEFISFSDTETNTENVWVYKNDSLPILFNEDYITDAYSMTDLKIGRDPLSYTDESVNITNKSTVRFNFTYSNFPVKNLSAYKHSLISNINLPEGTKIILIDNVKEKVYEYVLSENEKVFSFESFKEIGTDDKFYSEVSYYNDGVINESFTFILDLSNTELTDDYQNISIHMELNDTDDKVIRTTLSETIKKFNIYSEVEEKDSSATVYLSTDYEGAEILYNRDTTTEINVSSGLYYRYINGIKVIDTTFENKEMGISIKFVDDEGVILDRKYLKNIKFMIDDKLYYPEIDNIVRININTSIEDIIKTLKIITYESNNDLEDGIYYFKISNFISEDGKYYSDLNTTELSIPVKVDNRKNSLYSFDVKMNEENRIIKKTGEDAVVSFTILQNSAAENPNVRVSLYKKDYLTAYNQTYSIVDLKEYISDDLTLHSDKVYYALTSPVQYEDEYAVNDFTLNLITSNFDNIGYKLVFDLYDGNKKVGTIDKYFVVKSEGV